MVHIVRIILQSTARPGNAYSDRLIELISDFAFTYDVKGEALVLAWSTPGLALYLVDPLSNPPLGWLHKDDVFEVQGWLGEVLKGEPVRFACRTVTERWVSVAMQPIIKRNRVVAIIGAGRDITTQKQLELMMSRVALLAAS